MQLLFIPKYYTMPFEVTKTGRSPGDSVGQACIQLGWRIQHSSFLMVAQTDLFLFSCLGFTPTSLMAKTAWEFNKLSVRFRWYNFRDVHDISYFLFLKKYAPFYLFATQKPPNLHHLYLSLKVISEKCFKINHKNYSSVNIP